MEKSQETSFQSIEKLLNFIYYFIDGPDIDNLNILFNVIGYYDLVSYVIKNIDYYNLFLSNINKENIYKIIGNVIKIECRIIKIFFIYYNICYQEYEKIKGYARLRQWYENNIQSIKNKLKKIYYLSKKEMENREYDIDEMLLSLKEKDAYTDEELLERSRTINFNSENIDDLDEDKIFEEKYKENIQFNENKENKENKTIKENKQINKIKEKREKYCLIKFDLLLLYYSLFSYYQDSINEAYLSVPPKKNLLRIMIFFFKECFLFIKSIILSLYLLAGYIYKHSTIKKTKKPIELLQELSDIDKKCQSLDENEMFIFLTNRIKCIEVSLSYLYKIYFPLLNKAKRIQDNHEIYLKKDNTQLSNYVNIILSDYDKINIKATQDYKVDKLIEFPIINILFKNNNLYIILLILIGLLINILIMLSYSNFTTKCENEKISIKSRKLFCPHLLYDDNYSEVRIKKILKFFGAFLFTLQCILFSGYIIRRFAQNYGLYIIDYKIKKQLGQRSGYTFSFFIHFIPEVLSIIFDFQTIYYLLSIFFMIIGMVVHPFFYSFALLEIVNQVDIMQTVLKAMYVPMGDILITLLMFIMLEYFFSMLALTQFTTHFPKENDSKSFLSAFMRMIDQTFKQDGGIGTYLDQTKDPDYQPYSARSYANGRFFFDLIFFLVVNTLIFQMFLSMIIDYFTSTKEKKEKFQEKSENQCLICCF